jgi:predicted aspartyl protease
MRILAIAAMLLTSASAPLWAEAIPEVSPANAQTVDTTTQATSLRARDDGYDRLTLPVRVIGKGPYRFLIDTGASRTAISSTLAAQLGLAAAPGATLYSVTGVSKVGTAHVPMLDWTAKQVTNVEAALLEPVNMGADGILGLDSLRSQRILFDFDRNTLTVIPSELRIREDPGSIVITGRARSGRLILTEASAGSTGLTLIVDTGAQISVGNKALRDKLLRGRKAAPGADIEIQSVTGEKMAAQFMVIPEISIGGVTLRNLAIVFADSAVFKELKLDSRPAMLLGMNALRGFRKVSIDVGRRRLRVLLPEESAAGRTRYAAL